MNTKKTKVPKYVTTRKLGRLNLVIDPDLKEWAHQYAREHHTSVTALIIDHLVHLKEREKSDDVEQI